MNVATLHSKLDEHSRAVLTFLQQNNNTILDADQLKIEEKELNILLSLIAKTSIEKGYELFVKVFSNVSTDSAKSSIKTNPLLQSNHSFTYGDIEFSSFVNILQRCEPRKGDVFVDLGHGTGRALVAASIVYGDVLSTIHGIELLSELVELSRLSVANYSSLLQTAPYCDIFGSESRSGILSIEEGDFLKETEEESSVDWTKADIIFANSTCFGLELMQQVALKAERLRPGAKMVTLTHKLPSSQFEVVDQRQYCMSWGAATCYIQIRR